MAWWVWALPLLGIAGLVIGFLVGRSSSAGIQRSVQLDQELRESRVELERYRGRVVEHFTTTAELVNRMTADYRAVYEHLASGAHNLAGNQVPHIEAITSARKNEPLEPPAGGIGDGLHEDPDDKVEDDQAVDEEATKKDSTRKEAANESPKKQSGDDDKAEGWYDDAAPGTEVPDYARDERFR